MIGQAEIDKLRPFLPEGFSKPAISSSSRACSLAIGPTMADYSPPEVSQQATREHAGEARIGPTAASRTTPPASLPRGDRLRRRSGRGVNIMWNFHYQWDRAGGDAHFLYSYSDRGERLPLYYEATHAC